MVIKLSPPAALPLPLLAKLHHHSHQHPSASPHPFTLRTEPEMKLNQSTKKRHLPTNDFLRQILLGQTSVFYVCGAAAEGGRTSGGILLSA